MSQILPSQDELLAHAAAEPAFAAWLQGHGPLQHSAETRAAVFRTAHQLVQAGLQPDLASVYQLFRALDRLTASALRIVVHMTYARRIRLDGQPLQAEDFKTQPEGHTGGALNMVPAYAGYLALNVLTGKTRAWLMGQGHCVAAIDALNVLTGNLHPEQERAYADGEEGLNRLLQDFYGYAQAPNGAPAAPLGSHVNPHTAGGIAEGGYLGFAELQYAHMPLPGETLVAFLSDGAAEEQRGSDWIPRWWRAEDCGAALPVMIANGRRIEQRTELGTHEGLEGFKLHLRRCGFDPISFDGRDPAAFVCTLWEMEQRLERRVQEKNSGILRYPLPIPYGIAETVKGFGFYGAGSNAAHNLPLPGNPHNDEQARQLFNQHANELWSSLRLSNWPAGCSPSSAVSVPSNGTTRWPCAIPSNRSSRRCAIATTPARRWPRWTASIPSWWRPTPTCAPVSAIPTNWPATASAACSRRSSIGSASRRANWSR